MTNDDNKFNNPRYTLRATYTPLPHKSEDTPKEKPNALGSEILRGANEDDDLYDPYSDVHDGTLRQLEFEKDPWN